MALQLRSTGWSIINSGLPIWYDGLFHDTNIAREVKFNDIKEGLLDSTKLQTDMFNGLTSIAPTANLAQAVTGQNALDILFSLITEGVAPQLYNFSRSGQVDTGTWLKIGEVASSSSPYTISRPITKLKLTLTNSVFLDTVANPLNSLEVSLFEKIDWITFNLVHKITLQNARSITDIGYLAVNFPASTEFCAKVTSGSADNPVLVLEVM